MISPGRGRKIQGSEGKSKLRRFFIEPSLDDELKYSCRILGIPISEGIRRGIIMFVKDTAKRYYGGQY